MDWPVGVGQQDGVAGLTFDHGGQVGLAVLAPEDQQIGLPMPFLPSAIAQLPLTPLRPSPRPAGEAKAKALGIPAGSYLLRWHEATY